MKFADKSVAMTPEILKRKLGGELLKPVTLVSGAFTNGVCKAGTPITADGGKASTTSSTNNAVGILLYDVTADEPVGSLIVAYATINSTVAQAHSGVTYDAPLKSALSKIVFE